MCNVCLAEVGPKKILDLMNVPWLTRENVASHLQVENALIIQDNFIGYMNLYSVHGLAL